MILTFVINASVLWHHGPFGHPSLLHRDRSTKGHCQSSTSIPPRLIFLSNALRHTIQSTLFRFSILRTFRLLRVFRPFRYNSTLLLYVPFSLVLPLFANARSWEFSTIEVMYLSFRRSKDALLALGFFVLMVVIVFSTLLYVPILLSLYSLVLSQTRQGILSSAVRGTTP